MRATVKHSRMSSMRVSEKLTKDSFKVVKKLGRGAFGSVFLVRKKASATDPNSPDNGRLFAMKELEK